MKHNNLIFDFSNVYSMKERVHLYSNRFRDCLNSQLEIISCDESMPINFEIIPDIMNIDNVKTIFKYPNLSFLNHSIIYEAQRGVNLPVNIDYSISFESNTGSYVHDYITGRKDVPEKFKKILHLMLENDFNLDPLLYIIETVAKGEKNKDFYDNFFSLKKLMTCDMDYYKNTKKIKSIFSDEILMIEALKDIESLENDYSEIINHSKRIHLIMKCILLLIIVSRYKYRKKGEDNFPFQLKYIVKFMDKKFQTIFLRELVVAIEYFNNHQFEFFNKIHNHEEFFKNINNMAWDFSIIRILESFYVSRPEENVDFFIPFIFSWDKGLLESMELFYCKDLLIFKKERMIHTVPSESLEDKIKEYNLDEYFTIESHIVRMNSPEPDLESILSELISETKRIVLKGK